MGTWGTGPFDSDGALDYLFKLARSHAAVDSRGDITPGTVDHLSVVADMRQTLNEVLGSHIPYEAYEEAYACAGLVTAVLGGHDDGSGGTRLMSTLSVARDDEPLPGGVLGLDAHLGYTALLTVEDAKALTPAARSATQALMRSDEWLSVWKSSADIRRALAELHSALS